MNNSSNLKLPNETVPTVVAEYNAQREIVDDIRNNGLKQLTKKIAPLAVLLVMAIGVAWFMSYTGAAIGIGVAGGLGLAFFYFWKRKDIDAPAEKLQIQMRERVLPIIFSEIENFNFEENVDGLVDKIPDPILPSFDKGEWGDLIEGKLNGRKFAINEIHLISRERSSSNNTRSVTKFKGVAVRFKRKTKLPVRLIVRNNRMTLTHWVSGKTGLGLQEPHIRFDDAKFEKRHDVHCDNEDFARGVFSDKGISLYHAMTEKYSTGKFQFVAAGRNVTMMIEQKHDFFELPPISQAFDENRDVARLREEIDGFMALMDDMEKLLNT